MNRSAVYIEREPLLSIILGAVEVYNRECFGYLFGYSPRGKDYYVLASAFNVSAIVRRTSSEIHHSKRASERLNSFMNTTGKLYKYMGDYHSHTWIRGSCSHLFGMSEIDAESVSKVDCVNIVLTIKRRSKKMLDWRIKSGRTRLRGSLGRFDFHLTAHALARDAQGNSVRDEAGKLQSYKLRILVARSTLQALNRAAKKP